METTGRVRVKPRGGDVAIGSRRQPGMAGCNIFACQFGHLHRGMSDRPTPSEEFDWDRAIAALHRILNDVYGPQIADTRTQENASQPHPGSQLY